MCALSNRIRETPSWWEGVKDEVVVEKWREEAGEASADADRTSRGLTPTMVRFFSL